MKCEGVTDDGNHKTFNIYSWYQLKFKPITPKTHNQLTMSYTCSFEDFNDHKKVTRTPGPNKASLKLQ